MNRVIALRMIGFSSARAVPALISMAFVAVLVRSLGARNYAYLSLATAIANTCATICSGWIAQGVLRYLPGRPERNKSVGGALRLAVILAVGATLASCLLGALVLLPPGVRWELAPGTCILSAVMMLQAVWMARVMVSGKSGVYAGSEIARSGAMLGLALLLGKLGGLELGTAVWVYIVSYLAAIGLLHAFEGKGRSAQQCAAEDGRSDYIRRAWLGRLWSFGSPMSFWLGIMVSLPLIDRAILISGIGATDAGINAASYDLFFRVASMLFGPVLMVLHPHIMRQINTGRRAMAARWVYGAFAAALVLSPLVALAVSFAAKPVAAMLGLSSGRIPFGVAFLLTLGGCLWQTALVAHKFLEMQRRTGLLLLCLVVSVGIHALLVMCLSPVYGSAGAASAAVCGACIYCVLTLACGHVKVTRGTQ